jgi:type II secretory pathway pseudopilin PulG
MAQPAPRHGERGFTLIETLIAGVVLMIGVMSTLALISRANAATSTTRTREAATSLARELIEASRAITYEDLNNGIINTRLQSNPGLSDVPPGGPYTIQRRNVIFTVTNSVCVMDDAKDGGGSRPSGLNFCAASTPADTKDKNPEDYKVVTSTVSWTNRGVTRTVKQTGVVNNPGSATGPSIKSLFVDGVAAPYEITTDVAFLTLKMTTSSKPTVVKWTLDGTSQPNAPTASDATKLLWQTNWTIHPAGGTALDDGPYLVAAEAFNQYGVSGPGRSETVTLNRFPPRKPVKVAGGRTSWGTVEIEWDANTERDIIGYDVRRSDGTVVCPLATQQLKTLCTDTAPPAGNHITYWVRAYDKAPGTGIPRASVDSDPLDVVNTNLPPNPPVINSYSRSNDVTTINWSKPSPADPDTGDSVAFYRIYRDGATVTDRYERWYDNGSNVTWQDTQTGGTAHTYYITAVDTHYAESLMVGPVIK